MSDVLVVLCTCPDSATADSLATGLVENGFAACVNILPEIRSIYRWENETQRDSEVLMVIKTCHDAYAKLESWLVDHHPYEVPEVLALPAEQGAEKYLEWIIQETTRAGG